MKRGWWLLLVPLVLIGALLALLGTQAGLQFSLYLARTYIPGDISVQRLEGRWLGPLQVESLQYQQEGQVYAVQQLQLDWQPMALLRGQVRVDRLHVTGVEVELGPVMPEPDEETAKPPMTPGLSLPLGIRIDDLQVDGVQVQRLAEPLAQLDRLQLAISGEGEEIQLGELTLVLPQGRLQITGSLGLGAHAQTALDMAWSADLESLQHLAGKAQLTGNWQQLQLQYALEKPASAQLDLQVREPLAGLQWQLRVQLPEGNLQRFSPAWPDLFLAGDVQAQGDNRQAQLAGRVHTDAGRSGQPYALDLNLEAEDTGDGWKLSMGRLQQPESGAVLDVSGEGMHGGYSQVTLEWQGLRWPLQDPPAGQEEPVWKSPEGTLGFSGTAKAYTLSAAARLEGSTLPPLQLKAEAKGDDQGLQLAPLHLALLDGTLDGEAQLQWQPALQWQAQLQLQNINPGRLQPEWPGTLQARLQVSGAEEKGQLQHHLQITDLSGQLRDYPLQANGQLWLASKACGCNPVQRRWHWMPGWVNSGRGNGRRISGSGHVIACGQGAAEGQGIPQWTAGYPASQRGGHGAADTPGTIGY